MEKPPSHEVHQDEAAKLGKRLASVLVMLAAVFAIGTFGYRILGWAQSREWSILDCAFMTVNVISTLGMEDVLGVTYTASGKIYSAVLVVVCMGILLYGVSTLTASLVAIDLGELWRKRKMTQRISQLSGHFIVCGVGRTGIQVVRELLATRRPFVAIDVSHERAEELRRMGTANVIVGDATEDEILRRAGVERATGLVAALSTDEENLYVTLSARQINKAMRIVAKALSDGAAAKLARAGADSTVSPYAIGGLRMASEMLRPMAVTFMDVVLRDRETGIRLEEVKIAAGAQIENKTLEEAQIQRRTGCLVVAVHNPNTRSFVYSPPPSTVLITASTVIVLGHEENVSKLIDLALAPGRQQEGRLNA